ncbi:MAG TPA: thiol reductant ABC exporter subunit CydD [Pseudonocardiaceae bacterium]|nr:thiol reductant ABC exporter subunit CydD [Pseudonocardiaceae bacterium]
MNSIETSPDRPTPARVRSGAGPLGALPRLSVATRRALVTCAFLATAATVATVVAATVLATTLAGVVIAHRAPSATELLTLAGAVLARALLAWANQSVAARAAAGAKEELRASLLDAALRLGPEWLAEYGPAELTSLATKGLDALDDYFTRYLPALITAAVAPPLVGAWILLQDWRSAILVAITVPLIPVFAILIGRFTASRASAAADATARLAGHLLELIRALPVLTAFGRAAAQATAVQRVSREYRRKTLATLRVAFLSALALEVIATLSVALVAVDIGVRLVAGSLGLATGLLVLILAPECYLPLRTAGAAHHASEDGLEAVRRVTEVLDAADNSVGAEEGRVPKGVQPDSLRHRLDVLDLRIARRGRYAPDGLTFSVEQGKLVRLDSPSGSGKSSTLAVLLGFAKPDDGLVLVDGVQLSTLDIEDWRRRIAWIPQRPTFSARTVTEELRLAVAEYGDVGEAELHEVAASVAAWHLREREVDELSTGERQRVAVARALLRVRRGAWLLLADEPTAHLDSATAAVVNGAIEHAVGNGAAVILATHSLAQPGGDAAPAEESRTVLRDEPNRVRASLRELVTARGLAGAVLGALALGSGVALTGTAAWLIATAAQHPPILTLSVAIVAVRAFGLAKGVLRYAERMVSHDAAFAASGALRVRLWAALVRLGPARTARLRRTDGLARLVDDTDTVRDLVPRVLQPPLVAVLVALASVVTFVLVLPTAALTLTVALLIAGVGGSIAAVLVARRATTALAQGRRELGTAVLALLEGAGELLANGVQRLRRAELGALDAKLAQRARRQAFGAGAASAITLAALGLASLASVWLAGDAVAAGRLAPVLAPVLALVPLALAETFDALGPAAQRLDALRDAHARIAEVLHEPIGQDRPKTISSDGSITLTNVDARWPGAAAPALRGVNLHIPAGSRVAVVGPSGAGKSTLLALLLGFLPPERGTLALPETVTWCPQEPQLVSTTVRENLRIADPDADDDALRAALTRAALPTWTDRLDTRLGATGATVSGGEGTRLALARALLHAKPGGLVLFDEPTAHLDADSAAVVLDTIGQGLHDHTVLHVTHERAQVAGADLIVEVRAGQVVLRESTTTHERALAGSGRT